METASRPTSVLRIAALVVIVGLLGLLLYYAPAYMHQEEKKPSLPHLKTGGTSVVSIIMENGWRTAYRKEKEIEIDYDSTGSTSGNNKMIDGDFAIAFTHAPLSEKQMKQAKSKGGEVLHLPVVLCSVVPVYNIKELKKKPPLQLTGEVLGDIFLGKIERWNDPALRKCNEGVELPDTKITVVHREDSSGTTLIFSDYLQGASNAWEDKIGPARSEIRWPVGVGKERNEGVAKHVSKTEGAIGYVDLVHAWNLELPYAALQNSDKTAFVHAEAEKMTAAAQSMLPAIPDDLTFTLTNRSGKDSYPISGVIWAVCYQSQPAANEKMVLDLLNWVTHDGQRYAKKMSYAPLPEELVSRVEQKLKRIKSTNDSPPNRPRSEAE